MVILGIGRTKIFALENLRSQMSDVLEKGQHSFFGKIVFVVAGMKMFIKLQTYGTD